MRTYFITIILLVAFVSPALSQNETEALKFSENESGGTARSLGLSGAMGALGGDATALGINPAGIGVYRASEFTFTMGVNNNNTTSDYLNTKYDDQKTKFNISNLAYIYTYNTKKNTGFVSASFGIAYNRLRDFNSNATLIGKNAQSSILDEFVYYANQIDQNLSFDQQESILKNSTTKDGPLYYYEGLAFKANELIFLNRDANAFYSDYMDFGYDLYQKKRIITKGGIGEYDFSFGTNFGNILYLGATVGVQNLNYERIDEHSEEANQNNAELNWFSFNEHFNAYGNGWNFKAGAIVRPIDFLRMGVAYHSPTYFNLQSEFYTSLDVDYDTRTDWFESRNLSTSDYTLKTPSKVVGSLAVIFDKYGLISMDVERIDYTKAHLRSDDYDFVDENSAIKDVYNSALNFRIGAEGKIGPFAIRGGYAKHGKPYVSEQMNSDYSIESYSGGIGIRGKSVFFDVAYVMTNSSEHHKLYSYERVNNENTPVLYDQWGKVSTSNSRIMATLGFRF